MHKHAARSKLLSLGSQIKQMENAIAILNEPLERARIEYRRIENQLAPISSLPDELLSIIFEVGCDLTSSEFPEISLEIWVSQVSHHWRNVALATSRLWTNVILGTDADMANVYLQRSKGSALRMSVHINEKYHTQEDITSFGHLVTLHAGRLHYIDIVCDCYEGFNIFLDYLPSAAPLLRQLTVSQLGENSDSDGDESEIPRCIFVDAPCLTAFLLRCVTPCCIPPLTNVTHLRIDESPLSNLIFRTLLTGPSTLTHLVIDNSFTNFTTVGTIELPSLRDLHIGDLDGCDMIPGLLMIISATSLEHLSLGTLVPDEITIIAREIEASPPKYPSLRSLTIVPFSDMQVTFRSNTWRSLMGAFPTVTHFTLLYDDFRAFLQSLHEQIYPLDSPDTPPLWPQLHTLTFLSQLPFSSVSLIRTALSARIASDRPIRKLQLSCPITSILEDDLQWMRAHVELEECAILPELIHGSSIISWPGDRLVSKQSAEMQTLAL